MDNLPELRPDLKPIAEQVDFLSTFSPMRVGQRMSVVCTYLHLKNQLDLERQGLEAAEGEEALLRQGRVSVLEEQMHMLSDEAIEILQEQES